MHESYRSGLSLYGNDLTGDALAKWYAEEELGYYQLTEGLTGQAASGDSNYWKHLNVLHVGHFLKERPFPCALAFGTANGDDMVPFCPQIDRILAVEPQESWWSESIAGTPTIYLKPGVDGHVPLADATVDLVMCLGVLHHVATVTASLQEFRRLLKPGGLAVIREPISSMGDWTQPRVGVTRNERGIDPRWMAREAQKVGLELVELRPVAFGPLQLVQRRMGVRALGPFGVRVDSVLARLFSWNQHYHRDRWWKKLAPGAAYFLLCRPNDN